MYKKEKVLLLNIGNTHWQSETRRMKDDKRQVKLDDQLPLFNFEELATATNNFHSANMLGKCGFGSVYKVSLVLYSHQLSKN